jgi:hypothetical protein
MEVPVIGSTKQKQIRWGVTAGIGPHTVTLALEGVGTLSMPSQMARELGVALVSAAAVSDESEKMKAWAQKINSGGKQQGEVNEELKRKIINGR